MEEEISKIDKLNRIIDITEVIYEMAGFDLSDTVKEMWVEDLQDKSMRQIEHAFKLYRREVFGRPKLPEFLKRTALDPSSNVFKPVEMKKDAIPMPDEVKKKLLRLTKKIKLENGRS